MNNKMKISKSKLHIFATALLLSFLSSTVVAQDVVNEEDIDKWLETHAVESTTKSTKKTTTKHQTAKQKKNTKVVSKSTTTTKPTSNSAQEIIAQLDTVEIAQQAEIDAQTNPMFLDMIFEYPRRTTSFSITDEDSTINQLRTDAKRDVALTQTESFYAHSDELPSIDAILNVEPEDDPKDLAINVKSFEQDKKLEVKKEEKTFWKFGGQFSAQISQSYVSDNWHKGGESSLAGIAEARGFANYNNEKNIQWDNKAEFMLGMNTMLSDTARPYRITQDVFSVTSKLGIKAFKSFYYTAEGEFSTQFCNNYVSGSDIRTTAPFSPVKTYLSIGLDYKYKTMLSVFLAPASYKFIFVGDTTVREGVDPEQNIARKLGIEKGHRSLHQVGGLLKVTFKHTFIDVIGLESDLSFYANYIGEKKGVELDWRISANFLINRYLSAKITLNPRYDSTIVLPDGEKPKIQFYELISIGFNYKI